jgi:DNA-binding response OmpR family regulator
VAEQMHPILLISRHADTRDLYGYALEQAGFACKGIPSIPDAVAQARQASPAALVVQLHPSDDPAEIGQQIREAVPRAALIGLVSMQLPVSTLKQVLASFDDVVLIPCSPDALVARLTRLLRTRNSQDQEST